MFLDFKFKGVNVIELQVVTVTQVLTLVRIIYL